MSDSEATRPVNVNVDRTAGFMTIDWADGHATRYEAIQLRLLCPCAFCRGEAGQPGWLDTNPELTADQTQLVAAGLVGQYALGLTWADGHDSGYYSWDWLRMNCPCPACCSLRLLGPNPSHADSQGHVHKESR
jgi:DUF971 family protein